jgi:hypothetical protein
MDRLEPITEFNSLSEYKHFIDYLAKRLSENEIEELKPKEYYHGKSPYGLNKDRWFGDCSSEEVWRLVPPDFPFKGFFEKVVYPLDGYKTSK